MELNSKSKVRFISTQSTPMRKISILNSSPTSTNVVSHRGFTIEQIVTPLGSIKTMESDSVPSLKTNEQQTKSLPSLKALTQMGALSYKSKYDKHWVAKLPTIGQDTPPTSIDNLYLILIYILDTPESKSRWSQNPNLSKIYKLSQENTPDK